MRFTTKLGPRTLRSCSNRAVPPTRPHACDKQVTTGDNPHNGSCVSTDNNLRNLIDVALTGVADIGLDAFDGLPQVLDETAAAIGNGV